MKDDPSTHIEHEIKSWQLISGDFDLWQPDLYNFKFNEIKDANGDGLNIDVASTTGEFRFILTVKSSDNINKMSSTTIRLSKNYVEFLNWEDTETLFAETDIDKRFRIYGDSNPFKVEIMQVGSGQQEDKSLRDVTDNLQSNSGSDYPYDYNCSTQGLRFDSAGTYEVYLKIQLENGQVLLTDRKTLQIKASEWDEVKSLQEITNKGEYLIMNVSTDDFAYDNGDRLYAKAVSDSECSFKFVNNNNNYTIQNTSTSDYVTYSKGYLVTNANSATNFAIAYDDGGYFKISYRSGNRTYYWRQVNSAGEITAATVSNNGDFPENMRWKIYKKSSSN